MSLDVVVAGLALLVVALGVAVAALTLIAARARAIVAHLTDVCRQLAEATPAARAYVEAPLGTPNNTPWVTPSAGADDGVVVASPLWAPWAIDVPRVPRDAGR